MSPPLLPGWTASCDLAAGLWVYTNLQIGAQQYDPPIYDVQSAYELSYEEVQTQSFEGYAQDASGDRYAVVVAGETDVGDTGTGTADYGNWDAAGADDAGDGYGDGNDQGYGDGEDYEAGMGLVQES
ncbi:hypothetical protein MMC18_002858 [Xylographa bjoerkii]|nr:hypothetical protein [Xylographa bjoerkii]